MTEQASRATRRRSLLTVFGVAAVVWTAWLAYVGPSDAVATIRDHWSFFT